VTVTAQFDGAKVKGRCPGVLNDMGLMTISANRHIIVILFDQSLSMDATGIQTVEILVALGAGQ
jgi:hypothetical protein